jgi:hypothetical protein
VFVNKEIIPKPSPAKPSPAASDSATPHLFDASVTYGSRQGYQNCQGPRFRDVTFVRAAPPFDLWQCGVAPGPSSSPKSSSLTPPRWTLQLDAHAPVSLFYGPSSASRNSPYPGRDFGLLSPSTFECGSYQKPVFVYRSLLDSDTPLLMLRPSLR